MWLAVVSEARGEAGALPKPEMPIAQVEWRRSGTNI